MTAIIGAEWGSEGKGVVASRLAYGFDVAVRTGGPNAGHSFKHQGRLYKMRSVPCAWVNPNASLVIGAGAVLKKDLLLRELESLPAQYQRVIRVDPQAALITDEDEHNEQQLVGKIGSTAEGVGEARIRRIRRLHGDAARLVRDEPFPGGRVLKDDVKSYLWNRLNSGAEVMLEGTQGSGLSLVHGTHPYVTSADTNVGQFLTDAGIAPSWLDHTLLVARTYPIRVGGHSGPMGDEIEWQEVPGAPAPEVTTVTLRQRRIARWSTDVVHNAIILNKPCGIVLTFLDYVDPELGQGKSYTKSPEAQAFVANVEAETGIPVVAIGVGRADWEVVELETCGHGRVWEWR